MKKLIYMEFNPSFNRPDIIERILYLSRQATHISDVYISISKSETLFNVLRIKNGVVIERSILSFNDLLEYSLKECNKIAVLDENGEPDLNILSSTDCYLAGLHTDIPYTELREICRNRKCKRIKLANISYLASSLISILDLVNEVRAFLYISILN
ncbi:MAG: hypothetical protein DRO13_02395 [Thermoprotei archaeon]|nr:MAG: hypothetical protein DRO13_02395 [Thermoprotei archaeon]